jgi:predicted sugar kinase
MKQSDLEELAEDALHVAVAHIQAQLGRTDGGFAAGFFTGEPERVITEILSAYARAEIEHFGEQE